MFKQLKISVERIHRRVAASLDKEVNGMGEGMFEWPLYCFSSLKKEVLKQM